MLAGQVGAVVPLVAVAVMYLLYCAASCLGVSFIAAWTQRLAR